MSNKLFKTNVLKADWIFSNKKKTIGISPSLDLICGGVVEGTVSFIVGPEKVGKTTTLLHFSAKAQRPENGGRTIYYGSVENRLKVRDLTSIPGLDMNKFYLISSTPEEKDAKGEIIKEAKILSAEDHLSIYEDILKENPGCVLIIDSESMLVTNNELNSPLEAQQRAEGAKLLAKWVRRNMPVITNNNNIVLVVRHIMANPSGFGTPTSEKGSRTGSYAGDLKLTIKGTERWMVKDKEVGKKILWRLDNGYLDCAVPGSSVTGYLRYGYGLDEESELTQLALDFGVVEQKGAWFYFGEEKFQGQESLTVAIKENVELKEKIWSKIKDLI